MPGRELGAIVGRGPRKRLPLRRLVLAVLLVGITSLLTAGAASADYWPRGSDGGPTACQSTR